MIGVNQQNARNSRKFADFENDNFSALQHFSHKRIISVTNLLCLKPKFASFLISSEKFGFKNRKFLKLVARSVVLQP